MTRPDTRTVVVMLGDDQLGDELAQVEAYVASHLEVDLEVVDYAERLLGEHTRRRDVEVPPCGVAG